MFEQPQLMVAVLAALAFALVLLVFAMSIRFANKIMRGGHRMRPTLRFGRGQRLDEKREQYNREQHNQEGEKQ